MGSEVMVNKRWTPLDMRNLVIYVGVLLVVVLGGFFEIRVVDRLNEMSSHLRLALMLRAIAIVESMESHFVLQKAVFEDVQAETFQVKAQRYFDQVRLEENKAQSYKEEADQYEQFAEEDLAQADAIREKIGQDETLRVELLKNISIDQKREDDLVDELHHIDKGLCDTRIAGWMCDVVGGAVELQRQADQEAIQIQQETSFLEQVNRREYMEKIVAASLQGNATAYNNIASELLQTAQYWDSLAQADYTNGIKSNATATELEEISERLHKRSENELQYMGSYFLHSEKEIETAVGLYKNAVRLATAAMVFSLFALGFFTPRVVSQLAGFAKSTCEFLSDGPTTDLEFWRVVCAALLHIGIFFISTGLCGDFVTLIDHYELRERAAIISWFATLAGLIQTLIVQTIPHVIAEWPLDRHDVWLVAKYSLLRLLVLEFLFGLELLIVYTTYPALVSSNVAALFGHPAMVLVGVAMAYLYLYVFEPRHSNASVCTTATLASEEVSCAASEATPLTTVDEDYCKNSIARTEPTVMSLLTMDLGVRCRDVIIAPSPESSNLHSMSPYFVRFDVELCLLKFPFEVLVVAALIGVLMDSLPLLYHYKPARVIVPLIFSLVTFIAVVARCCWVGLIGKRVLLSHKAYEDRHIEIVSL